MRLPLEDLHTFLRSRRSVRRFLSDPVPQEALDRIFVSAGRAPSAHNRQPWKVVILKGAANRAAFAEAMGREFHRDLAADGLEDGEVNRQVERSRQRIMEAPVAIVLCLDLAEIDSFQDEKRNQAERVMGTQGLALYGGTLLLAAHAEGLSGVWMCAPLFAGSAVRESLRLPETLDPQALILLGYPARIPEPRPKKPLEEVLVYR